MTADLGRRPLDGSEGTNRRIDRDGAVEDYNTWASPSLRYCPDVLRPEPLVSVIVPVWEKVDTVAATLRSVAEQTHPQIEVIIVDDASTDGSLAVVQDWMHDAARPCTLIRNTVNLGLNRSLNRGLAAASGEFIICLDADDTLLPHMVGSHVRLLTEHPDLVLVHGDGRRVDPHGRVLVDSIVMEHRTDPPPTGMIFSDLLVDSRFVHFSTVMMRRSAIDAVGGFDEALAYQDFDMLLRLARIGPIKHSGSQDAEVLSAPDSMSRTIGAALPLSMLRIFAKWRHDPGIPEEQLRTMAAACVLEAAGRQENMTLRSAVGALRTATSIYPDRRMHTEASVLLVRSGLGRSLRRVRTRRNRASHLRPEPIPSDRL